MKRACLVICVLAAASLSAQTSTRRATNLNALLSHPGYYHQRPIIVVGEIQLQDTGEMRVASDGQSLTLAFKGTPPDGASEIRGEFWDLGRMNADDPRFGTYDMRRTFKVDPEGAWPRPGQVLAIIASAVAPATPAAAPSVRNIVLYPSRYLDQQVTVTGQFAGRNLLGDLPDAPAQSRWDFVIRSADAAIWVTNLRPRGRDFELALDARLDTGRWVEVSGKLQQGRGLQWLDGTGARVQITQAPKDTAEEVQIQVPAAPPPEVIFSTPIPDETEVALGTNVRVQFSRDLAPASLRGKVLARYVTAQGAPVDGAPAIELTSQYMPGTRVLEIRFTKPLERFQTVKIELLDGIVGTDTQALAPWSMTFQTGS
jgi:hypothetical protein